MSSQRTTISPEELKHFAYVEKQRNAQPTVGVSVRVINNHGQNHSMNTDRHQGVTLESFYQN